MLLLNVPAQFTRIAVLAIAQPAPEFAHARVLDEVSAQVRRAGEALAAVRTRVRVAAAVHVLVRAHVFGADELFAADGARELLDARVPHHVTLQVAGGDEALAAVGTRVRVAAAVRVLVRAHLAGDSEPLPADRAAVRARVADGVTPQAVGRQELLAARLAVVLGPAARDRRAGATAALLQAEGKRLSNAACRRT